MARWGAFGAAALVFSSGILPPVPVAEAQERYYQRRSILDFFTGRRYIDEAPQVPDGYAPPRAIPQKKKKAPPKPRSRRPALPRSRPRKKRSSRSSTTPRRSSWSAISLPVASASAWMRPSRIRRVS
jgi:hypothetical protein